eukprot:782340-Pelagomonas_calceolata.AAC.2
METHARALLLARELHVEELQPQGQGKGGQAWQQWQQPPSSPAQHLVCNLKIQACAELPRRAITLLPLLHGAAHPIKGLLPSLGVGFHSGA